MIDSDTARPRYNDRVHAGYELATELRRFVAGHDTIVLAIPRGGVPVAAAVADELGAPLDLIIPRRIGAPADPDTAIGAIMPDRTLVINRPAVDQMHLTDRDIEKLSVPVWAEVQRIQQLYRRGRPDPELQGRTVVIVDDRLTTGYTMMAAIVSARKMEPARIVVAVPVGSLEGIERVRGYADELFSSEISIDPVFPGSRYYASWIPLTDREVIWTLERHWSARPPTGNTETF